MRSSSGQPRPLTAGFLFVLGMGCSGTRQGEPDAPILIAATSPSATASSATPGATETALQDTSRPASKCAPEGTFPPLARQPKPVAPLPCRPADLAAEKPMEADMLARYVPTRNKSTVEIKFGCDGLDRVISRIVLETGGGHEGTLNIIEISRPDPNGLTYDVTGVRLNASMVARAKSPFEIMRSTLSQEVVFSWMPLVRAALRTTIEEIPPKPDPNARTGGGSAFGSTSNVHVVVRIEDTSTRAMEGHYTGYEGSVGQAQYLPLQRAQKEIEQALAGSTWRVDLPPDEFRHFFERRFVDAQKRFSEPSASWVRERYMKLASHLGTRALVPLLLPHLTATSTDASSVRTRDYAFEALVSLTGWDPRAPKNGEHPRTIEAAAGDFIKECGDDRIRAESK